MKQNTSTSHVRWSQEASRSGGSFFDTPMTNGSFCIFGVSTQMQRVRVSTAVEKPLVERPFVEERAELG